MNLDVLAIQLNSAMYNYRDHQIQFYESYNYYRQNIKMLKNQKELKLNILKCEDAQ